MNLPFFHFYPKDWAGDPKVNFLTHEEKGVYIDLLVHMWNFAGENGECCLPNDDKLIANLIHMPQGRWKRIKERLSTGHTQVIHIDEENGSIFNKRLRKEFSLAKKRSDSAKKSAKFRWDSDSEQSETTGESETRETAKAQEEKVKAFADAYATAERTQSEGICESHANQISDPDPDISNTPYVDTTSQGPTPGPEKPRGGGVLEPPSLESLLARYTVTQRAVINEFWSCMRQNRRTGKLAESVIVKWMDKWSSREADVVLEAMDTHIQRYGASRDEAYTNGIMNRIEKDKKAPPPPQTKPGWAGGRKPESTAPRKAEDIRYYADFAKMEEAMLDEEASE